MQIYIDKIKSPLRRLLVSAILSVLLTVQAVGNLRPVTILPFIIIAQMALFVRFISYDLNLMLYAAGNVAVVCAALVPMTIRKPIKAHWVK